MEFEKLYKELAPKVEALDASLTQANATIATIRASEATLKAEVEKLTGEKMAMDKELTISKANAKASEEKAAAEKIQADVLKESTLSEVLQAKVKGWVNYTTFKKEDGSFDAETYKTKFSAEVKDLEAQIKGNSGGIGFPEYKSESVEGDGADIKYGQDLARKLAGNIRSDEK